MGHPEKPAPGTIAWHDLTVGDADRVRDFYAAVVGWRPSGCEMGGYEDYNMHRPPDEGDDPGECVAGVCHARGVNADLPPVWMVYIVVEDLATSVARCRELGGDVLREPSGNDAYGLTAVIRDPAGAVCSLYQPGPE